MLIFDIFEPLLLFYILDLLPPKHINSLLEISRKVSRNPYMKFVLAPADKAAKSIVVI